MWYAIGQIEEVGHHFYNTDVKVDLVSEESSLDGFHFILQLTFNNQAYYNALRLEPSTVRSGAGSFRSLAVNAAIFLQIFPFSIVFDPLLTINAVGDCLKVRIDRRVKS